MATFNLFKSVFGNVATLAKAMDNNIDKFCDSLLKNLKEHYEFDTFTEEGEYEAFKEKVVVKAFEVFSDFKVKVKKPKADGEEQEKKKRTTGFILFNLKKREEISNAKNKPSFEEIGKIIGDAWKSLSDEEKEQYNKEAAKQNGVEYKKVNKEKNTLPICEHENCEKKVKGEALDGVFLCSEHKKARQEKKPVKVCAHMKKGGIRCSTSVKEDQEFCSKHKEKKEEEKKEKKEEEKKEEKKKEEKKKEEPKKELSKEEKAKQKILKKCTFDFTKEKPVNIKDTNDKTFWVTKGIKGSSDRVHQKTGLVLNSENDKVYLVGLNLDGELCEESDMADTILNWVEKCNIITERSKSQKKLVLQDSDDELEESEDELAELDE
jgi:hypothetical protein